MRTPTTAWLNRLLALTLLAFAAAASAQSVVTGTASYRERMALPPGAVFEATLLDVSRAGAPAETVGRTRIESPGNPPIRFEIAYDPAHIRPERSYAVRATIREGGRLLFTTDTHAPVLTRGSPSEVTLTLVRTGGAQAVPRALGSLPATFEGDLPCADCPAIRYHLDLFPGGAYFLRTIHVDRPPAGGVETLGRWAANREGSMLMLALGQEPHLRFAIRDTDTLRLLDRQGRAIESAHNHDLRRAAAFAPIEPRGAFAGTYTYRADAGRFTECRSGLALPVAAEGDNAALEHAYSGARRTEDEALVVSVEGRIAQRPAVEGSGLRPMLLVERYTGIWPGESCGAPFATATLANTYWKLTRLGGVPVLVGAKQREPHLVLREQEMRVTGSGGCNRFSGSYALDGDRISFGQIAATMMACLEGMDHERPFFDALSRAASWRMERLHLELLDAGGAQVARFEARYMK